MKQGEERPGLIGIEELAEFFGFCAGSVRKWVDEIGTHRIDDSERSGVVAIRLLLSTDFLAIQEKNENEKEEKERKKKDG